MDLEDFLERLKDPAAAPLVAELKTFLEEFKHTPRLINAQRKRVLGFIARASAEALGNPAFASVPQGDSPTTSLEEAISEGWEKLVLTRVYESVFPATEEEGPNAVLGRRLEALSWVSEKHLDLPFPVELQAAGKELSRLSEFRSPRDKLTLLLNCSQLVADLVKRAAPGSAGNDYLLPALILVILRARPVSLISHVKFIMRFRNQEKLNAGATQYCITNMMGAISFLYNLSEKSLTLADEERAQYFPATVRSAANKIDSRSPSPNTPGLPELQQFASQVSGFFGSFVREVKTLSTDAAGKVEGFVSRLGKQTGVEDDDEESAEFPGNTSGQRPRATAAAARREAEEEDYELQMALALSLSLQDTERIDPDTVKELEMEGVNVDALLAPSPDVETPKVDIDATKKTDLDKPELPTMSSEELLDDIRDAVQEVPENRDTVEEVHEDTGESGQEDPKDIMETVQDEAEPPSQSSSENKSSRRKK